MWYFLSEMVKVVVAKVFSIEDYKYGDDDENS